MLTVLSPAKSLDFESKLPTRKYSEPRMLDQSTALIEIMRTKTPSDISALMHISDDLAHLNATRYAQWVPEHTLANARQALLAFNGDVYQGMRPDTFDARDFTDSQKTQRILSGLYGLLRPLDLIEPYRLEMGTRLVSGRGGNLYQWWGTRVTDLLAKDLEASPGSPVLVNLASFEYSKVIDIARLDTRVVSPRFEDRDASGRPRIVSFYAKRARGAMAGWLVRNRIRSAAHLVDFDADGYTYDEARSSRDEPVFVR